MFDDSFYPENESNNENKTTNSLGTAAANGHDSSTETNQLLQTVLNQHTSDEDYELKQNQGNKSLVSKMGSNVDSKPSKHQNVEEEDGAQLPTENKYTAPDGGWGWFVVVGSFLNHLILNGLHKCGGVIYLQLLERFQMSATATSWVIAIHSTLTLILGPLVSALSTKFSVRFVVYIGAVLTTVGSLVSVFSPNIGFMYFSYGVLTGVGRAMAYSPSLVMLGHYFDKRRGLAIGIASSGGGLGNIFFPPMVEMLFNFYGFAGTFLIFAAIYSHFWISGSLFRSLDIHHRLTNRDRYMQETSCHQLPIVEEESERLPSKSTNNKFNLRTILQPKTEQPVKSLISKDLKDQHASRASSKTTKSAVDNILAISLFKNYAFTTLCLLIVLFDSTYELTFVFLPALVLTKGLTQLEGAYLLGITGISNTLTRILISIFLDLKRVKRFRLLIYNMMMFSTGVVAVVIPSMATFWQFAIIGSVYGILTGTCVSQMSLVVIDILGVEKLSSSYGLLVFFRGVGALIGPVIGGILKDFLGSYEMAFYVGSIGSFVGALLFASGNIWLHIHRSNPSKSSRSYTANNV